MVAHDSTPSPRYSARLRPKRGKRPQRWGVYDGKHNQFVPVGPYGLRVNHFETEPQAVAMAAECEKWAGVVS